MVTLLAFKRGGADLVCKFPPITCLLLFSNTCHPGAVNVNAVALVNWVHGPPVVGRSQMRVLRVLKMMSTRKEEHMGFLNTLLQSLYTLFQYLYSP